MKLSLVIPCYNEAENFPAMFERIASLIATAGEDLEVIFVDNGSTDNTAQVLSSHLTSSGGNLRSVRVEVNQGYGFGILSGLAIAKGDYLAWTHADMQTDPLDVWQAYQKALSTQTPQDVLVKGRRRNRQLLEQILTFGMQLYVWVKLGHMISDINAQPKLFSRKLYKGFLADQAPHDFSLDLYLLYTAKKIGLPIETVPVVFAKRLRGEAKGGGGSNLKTRIKLIKRTIAYVNELSRARK